jgi:hypothetical protein
MSDWMHSLATHYFRMRARHPQDDLLVVFDIDGTILDMRHMVCRVLLDFDREHGTSLFYGLRAEDITTHENQVEGLLEELGIPSEERERVHRWYLERRWSRESVLAAHRPYQGVLDIIRWFQLQPRTLIGLNSGRPESLREDTLESLNALGREYRVEFPSELLQLNPGDFEEGVISAKAEALRHFRAAGHRIVAVVENEPENIAAMAEADTGGEILFLHADTLFESKHCPTPRTVSGRAYDVTRLVSKDALPRHLQLVWHGANDRANLRQFLASPVHWGECDVRTDPLGRLVLRHDGFDSHPWSREEHLLTLDEWLAGCARVDKGIKLDLKEGAEAIDRVAAVVARYGFPRQRLWFNGALTQLGEAGFRRLAALWPGAVLQCPVDFLVPLVLGAPRQARELLETLRSWGINRLSLDWRTERQREIFECLDSWGHEVNFYNVPDLESFLQAALLLPRSVTSDFNFPQWDYFGRGSGQDKAYHRYADAGVGATRSAA